MLMRNGGFISLPHHVLHKKNEQKEKNKKIIHKYTFKYLLLIPPVMVAHVQQYGTKKLYGNAG